jgi:phospholipid/cholesterol/gamma-HCH transport system substrate-binding protein
VLVRAALLAAIGVGLVYVALTATRGLPAQSQYRIHTRFANAIDIVRGSDVLIAGEHVGQVLAGRSSTGASTLTLALKPTAGPLPVDSTARIGYSGLLGALNVQITRGHARRMIPNGGLIPISQTSTAPELTDVLGTFDPVRRAELRTVLTQLGTGLMGRGEQLNGMIAAAPGLFSNLRALSASVVSRPGAASHFFPYLETLSHSADPVRDAIANGFAPESEVFKAIAAQDHAVAQLLDTAPSALDSVRAGLAESDPLLVQATALAVAARATIGPSPPALRETTGLLNEARGPLSKLRPLLSRTQAAIPSVLTMTSTIDPIIARTRQALLAPLPILSQLILHGCDVLTFSKNWRSMLAFAPPGTPTNNPIGPENLFRVEVESSGRDESFFGRPPADHAAVDGYPAPCTSLTERLP